MWSLVACPLTRGRALPLLASTQQEFSGEFTTHDRYNPDVKVTGRLYKSVGADGRTVLEGVTEYVEPTDGSRVRITLRDSRAYMEIFNDTKSSTTPQRVVCYPDKRLPAVGDLDELFTTASLVPVDVLDEAHPGMGPCIAAGNRWSILWGVQEFVYCQPQNDVHVIVGDNFNAEFVTDTYLQRPELPIPTNVTDGAPARCDAIVQYTALNGGLGHHGAVQRRVLKQERRQLVTPRPCVFVGGLGLHKSEGAKSTQGADDYWGDKIVSYLSGKCSSFKFVQRDMKGKGWDDPSHATTFCNDAVTSGSVIDNTLIFSHGSGSLVVANALVTNECSFSTSTRWYSAMAPFGGSKVRAAVAGCHLHANPRRGMVAVPCAPYTVLTAPCVCLQAADKADDLCANYDAMSSILSELRFCKGKNHDSLHAGVESLQTWYVGAGASFNDVRDEARANLDGALCGHDSSGLYLGVGQGLQDFDSAIYFGEDRDGMMKISQCTTAHWSTNLFQEANSKTSVWANQHLNYLDGTCRFGDPYVDEHGDRSPCTWYAAMANRA